MFRQQTLARSVESTDGPEVLHTDLAMPSRSREARGVYPRFFFWLFLLPAILYFTAIPLIRVPSYERWGLSHWGPVLDFAWHTEGLDADVVIFGDSSAFLGIDPHLVDQQLHLKSVVLPNTVGSLPVNGEQALEFYLAHNTRPRLIVLYFTAWDLNYGAAADTPLYEGEEMLLRHGTAAQIAEFAFKHPLELPAFPLRNYSTVGPTILKTILRGADRESQTAAALGHVDDREPYPPIGPNCALPPRFLTVDKADSVRALAQNYRARAYDVAVYLAPMPACPNAAYFASQTYDGLAVAPPATLPTTSFKQDGFYAHIIPESVPAASRLFAETIKARAAATKTAF